MEISPAFFEQLQFNPTLRFPSGKVHGMVCSNFPGGQPAAAAVPGWGGPASTRSRNSSPHVLMGLRPGFAARAQSRGLQEAFLSEETSSKGRRCSHSCPGASFAAGLPTRADLGSAVLLPVLSMQASCLQLESLISSYLYILIPDRLSLLTVCKESRGIYLPLPALK